PPNAIIVTGGVLSVSTAVPGGAGAVPARTVRAAGFRTPSVVMGERYILTMCSASILRPCYRAGSARRQMSADLLLPLPHERQVVDRLRRDHPPERVAEAGGDECAGLGPGLDVRADGAVSHTGLQRRDGDLVVPREPVVDPDAEAGHRAERLEAEREEAAHQLRIGQRLVVQPVDLPQDPLEAGGLAGGVQEQAGLVLVTQQRLEQRFLGAVPELHHRTAVARALADLG